MSERMELLEAEVRRLAAEYPNARYQNGNKDNCYYTLGRVENGPDTPGCIIGQALINTDIVPIEELQLIDSHGAYGIDCLFNEIDVPELEDDEVDIIERFFADVQSMQDRNYTWGEAVERATEAWKEHYDLVY